MNANPILLQMKHAKVITTYAKRQGITNREALGVYYTSMLYQLVREGVSDMHCRSEEYLAEELEMEKADK